MQPHSVPSHRLTVDTAHGSIAVRQHGDRGTPVLFIHGNSTCGAVFDAQLHSALAERHRLIAIDLPGHGDSGDAPDPLRSYTRPGLTQAALEVLAQLDLAQAVVVGWSLGGHVGIEMLGASRAVRALMIVGAPPIAAHGWAEGFRQLPQASLASRAQWSPADADVFLSTIFGRLPDARIRQAALRTDGRLRARLFEAARQNPGVDQRRTVEASRVPLAVVNGADDPLIKLDYFDSIAFGNLWERHCHRLAGAGHAPFWQTPDAFTPLLARFLHDVGAASA